MCFDSGRFLLAASRSTCFSMTSQVAKSISFALALRCLPSITRRFPRSCAICFCRRYSGDCRGYLRCCRLRLAIMRISLLCGASLNPFIYSSRHTLALLNTNVHVRPVGSLQAVNVAVEIYLPSIQTARVYRYMRKYSFA